jgi:hypothetical protein
MEGGNLLRRAHGIRRAFGERVAYALLAAAALAPLPAAAAGAASAPAQAQILPPFNAGPGADMQFGQITTAGPVGTVTIPASATPTCTMTGTLIHVGACRAARFDGDTNWLATLRVTKPAGNKFTLTGPAGATMLVDNLQYTGAGMINWVGSTATEQVFLVTNFDGTFSLFVGGRLNVGVNQRPGHYTGTFTLTFNYD